MQRPAQVFSCEYCKNFKNTSENASANEDFSDKFTKGRYFLHFIIILIKAFSIYNFS